MIHSSNDAMIHPSNVLMCCMSELNGICRGYQSFEDGAGVGSKEHPQLVAPVQIGSGRLSVRHSAGRTPPPHSPQRRL